jgi:hypothetical protein
VVLLPPRFKNVVIWGDASTELASVLDTLLEDESLETTRLTEGIQMLTVVGEISPPLPLAHRIPRGGYKEPHWLPIGIRRAKLGDQSGSPCNAEVTPCRTMWATGGDTEGIPNGVARAHAKTSKQKGD